MGAPPAESRPRPSGSVDGGVATMTCVPCVAVLEPGSAPESRTDSKRDSEEEPVRELELEVRRESIELRSIELRRVCEHVSWGKTNDGTGF